jgi:hypothetical protein
VFSGSSPSSSSSGTAFLSSFFTSVATACGRGPPWLDVPGERWRGAVARCKAHCEHPCYTAQHASGPHSCEGGSCIERRHCIEGGSKPVRGPLQSSAGPSSGERSGQQPVCQRGPAHQQRIMLCAAKHEQSDPLPCMWVDGHAWPAVDRSHLPLHVASG